MERQLPVGLFDEEKYGEKHAIFPAKHAAVDLWSVDEKFLYLYELKCPGNIPIGIFSELWFYSMFMNDVLREKFKAGQKQGKIEPHLKEIKSIGPKIIQSFFLVQRLHPALTYNKKDALNIVNSALEKAKFCIKFDMLEYELNFVIKDPK